MFDPARWPPALLGTAVGALILLIVLLIGALLLSQARLRRAQGRWSQASRGRNAAAQRGEREAERLLQAHGYEIIDRQATLDGALWVDGERRCFTVRLDLLVRRDGQDFIAEVKTGDRAPDPLYPPTRRQLLEYALLLPDYGVLLIDMEQETIIEVEVEVEGGAG
jgi:hypothetical protein